MEMRVDSFISLISLTSIAMENFLHCKKYGSLFQMTSRLRTPSTSIAPERVEQHRVIVVRDSTRRGAMRLTFGISR